MKIWFTIAFITLTCSSFSGTPETASSMVPRGKVIETIGRDYKVKTRAGTKIDIEFRRDGRLEEARGLNLNKGDELEPGEGLISLSTAAQKLHLLGNKVEGFWVLEQDEEMGWIYEFSEAIVSARDGRVIKTKRSPLPL